MRRSRPTWSTSAAYADRCLALLRTELAVRDRIKQAKANVEGSMRRVGEVRERLRQRVGETGGQLAAMEAERRQLLTG